MKYERLDYESKPSKLKMNRIWALPISSINTKDRLPFVVSMPGTILYDVRVSKII